MTAALRSAIDLFHMPSHVRHVRREPLPDGVYELLQIAAGDNGILQAASERLDRDPGVVRDAAVFFIEQVLLLKDADSYRTLGTTRDAPTHELRRNAALLLKWLHPDAQSPDGRGVLAARVTAAWNDLKTLERRAAYDRLVAESEATQPRRSRNHAKGRRSSAATLPTSAVSRLTGPSQAKPGTTLLRKLLSTLSGRFGP